MVTSRPPRENTELPPYFLREEQQSMNKNITFRKTPKPRTAAEVQAAALSDPDAAATYRE